MDVENIMFTNILKPIDFIEINCRDHKPLQNSLSSLKANVFRMQCGNKNIVVKDYSHANVLLRITICRFLLKREMSVLYKLQGIKGVPHFYGLYGKHGFAMQAIEGCHPDMEFFSRNISAGRQLNDLVDNFHHNGITHNDLRLNNIIIDRQGELFIIDYAAVAQRKHKVNILGNFLFSILKITDKAKTLRVLQQSPSFKVNRDEERILKAAKPPVSG